MNKKIIQYLLMPLFFLLLGGPMLPTFADDDHHYRHDDDDHHYRQRERERERHRENHHDDSYLKKVDHPVYKEQCGDCHFAYQPELLPSASWKKILENLDDHFGEPVEIDDETKRAVSVYLTSNGAETSSSEIAVKIMRSLGNRIPLRITDIKYITKKHHEISADILNRESIGSLSNCSACHITAENGFYDDDDVRIPK
jgi:hypothetical protein